MAVSIVPSLAFVEATNAAPSVAMIAGGNYRYGGDYCKSVNLKLLQRDCSATMKRLYFKSLKYDPVTEEYARTIHNQSIYFYRNLHTLVNDQQSRIANVLRA